jgi:hypothetical protein
VLKYSKDLTSQCSNAQTAHCPTANCSPVHLFQYPIAQMLKSSKTQVLKCSTKRRIFSANRTFGLNSLVAWHGGMASGRPLLPLFNLVTTHSVLSSFDLGLGTFSRSQSFNRDNALVLGRRARLAQQLMVDCGRRCGAIWTPPWHGALL